MVAHEDDSTYTPARTMGIKVIGSVACAASSIRIVSKLIFSKIPLAAPTLVAHTTLQSVRSFFSRFRNLRMPTLNPNCFFAMNSTE